MKFTERLQTDLKQAIKQRTGTERSAKRSNRKAKPAKKASVAKRVSIDNQSYDAAALACVREKGQGGLHCAQI